MSVSLIGVGVRQQYVCFDTHTFIQFSTYDTTLCSKFGRNYECRARVLPRCLRIFEQV